MKRGAFIAAGASCHPSTWDLKTVGQIAKPHDENGKRYAGKFYTPGDGRGTGRRLAGWQA